MQQISEMSIGPDSSTTETMKLPSKTKLLSRKNVNNKKVVETPTFLSEGQPIEFIYKKKLMFGNFIKYNERTGSSR